MPLLLQVTYGLGSAVVNVFARVDEFLEGKRWFTTLVPPPIPSEVFDATTGSMKGECRQVRTPGVCSWAHGAPYPMMIQRGLSYSWGRPDMPASQFCQSVKDARMHSSEGLRPVCHARTMLLLLQIRDKLKQLKLSNKAVWDREHTREAAGGGVDTPWYVRAVYYSLCLFLDVAFDNR